MGDSQKEEEEYRKFIEALSGRTEPVRGWAFALGVVAGLIAGVVAYLIEAGIIALGWNLALAAIIGLPKINVLQALAIMFYVLIMVGLFKSFWNWALK